MEKYILPPIFLLASTVWIFSIWSGLKNGKTPAFKFHAIVHRNTNPGAFWFTIVIRAALAFAFGAVGINALAE